MIEKMSLEELKKIHNYLSDKIGYTALNASAKYHLEIRDDKVEYFSRGYGPYPDEWDIITSKPEEIEKYKLLFILKNRISELEKIEKEEIEVNIEKMISQYFKETL
ncbi:hypothetical protein D3C87_76960 [compost metagenome]